MPDNVTWAGLLTIQILFRKQSGKRASCSILFEVRVDTISTTSSCFLLPPMPSTRSESARNRKAASNNGSKSNALRSGGRPATQAPAPLDVSAAALATYKMVQAKLQAQKKAVQEAEDAGEYS